MLKKSIALFLLRWYPSGDMGMLTLPHHTLYKHQQVKTLMNKFREVTYILGSLIEDNSLFLGGAAGLGSGWHGKGSSVGDGGCVYRWINWCQVLWEEGILIELGGTMEEGKLVLRREKESDSLI